MKFPVRVEHLQRTVDGVQSTYMRRLVIGRLHVHLFYRGDGDEHPHDHPWNFWTFPLSSYIEEVYQPYGLCQLQVVTAFRWHYRPAHYAHRVMGRLGRFDRGVRYEGGKTFYGIMAEPGKWVTIVWKSKKRRDWGFWTERGWVGWREYIAGWRN